MADDVKRAGNESAPAKESGTNFIHAIIEKDLEQQKYSRQIMTRFPPEPNGYLHIGHAKSICLNFGTALKYGGGCNLRYDDTNPVTEDEEFVGSIEEDVKWLGFQWDNLLYASDYFETMFEGAVKLIKAGKAYVCELTADEIRSTRGTLTEPGTNSPYRDRPIEESLQMFMDMRAGKYEDGSVVLRAKIDMASPNINMRDPVIFRVLHATHHNTGDAWCIYPMYDYAHPIEDAVEGITHSICTLEFEDHRPFYDWVLENLEWPEPPQQIEFAKLNLSNTIMSKRNIKRLVGEGEVEGWDDPRLCTIAGIRRRGYTPEAIRAFCDAVGVAKANSQVEMSMLEYFVRDDLKERVESRMVILDPVKVVLTNYPEDQQEMLPVENNMSVPEMGLREVPFSRVLYIER
ncbi:MAG: glutamine--tRNA ligase, partial [Bacillota bacterium]|nr:glutamine--tRNA ligase [Bacillota bacterium]